MTLVPEVGQPVQFYPPRSEDLCDEGFRGPWAATVAYVDGHGHTDLEVLNPKTGERSIRRRIPLTGGVSTVGAWGPLWRDKGSMRMRFMDSDLPRSFIPDDILRRPVIDTGPADEPVASVNTAGGSPDIGGARSEPTVDGLAYRKGLFMRLSKAMDAAVNDPSIRALGQIAKAMDNLERAL